MRLKQYLIAALALIVTWCGLGIEPALAAYDMPYYIEVDLTNQIVTIFNTKDNNIVRQMLCSSGENCNTPTGTFYMPPEKGTQRELWYYMAGYPCWVKYATPIYMGIWFHSIMYSYRDESGIDTTAVKQYGMPASHGCIRLRVPDAKFIAQNCLRGTRVHIYYSDQKNEALRKMLYVSAFDEAEGISYKEYLGIPEDALILGDKGEAVSELQLRLRDLGFYEDEVDGDYSTNTIKAVKKLQKELGLTTTGIATRQLREVIFSDEAPVIVSLTINEGMSGPLVLKLQQALAGLGLYDGELDSVYDADVMDAVKELQTFCGYDADGVATAEIQHLAYYQLNRIRSELGEDFSCERVSEDVNMGTMNLEGINAIVRSKASTKSDELTKLHPGDPVVVLGTKGQWAQVVTRSGKGYMYTEFLTPSVEKNYVMKYTGNGETITLGNTLEQITNGETTSERERFRKAYDESGSSQYLEEVLDFVTVNTGSDSVSLNLRAEANAESEILGEIPNGTMLRVLGEAEGYTRVGYDDEIGYLANDYLIPSEGTAADVKDSSHALNPNYSTELKNVYAKVMLKRENSSAPIYAKPDSNSKVLGYVGWGKMVNVTSDDEDSGWALIERNGQKAYIRDMYLTYKYT